jgi:fatty-acyl-CoA synthase
MPTVAELLLARADDERTALLFEDRRWSWREYVLACIARAHLLLELRGAGPFHVGVLLDNVPEYPMLLGAAALAGAAVVGINPTRRGAELERDIRHSDAQILVSEEKHANALAGLELPIAPRRRFEIESEAWREAQQRHAGKAAPTVAIDPRAPYLLIFTSGTTGHPKAAICSQARLAGVATVAKDLPQIALRHDDVTYLAMPLFHSNALMVGWATSVAAGAAMALRRKFSASGFLPDLRRHGCTYMPYVGKPLSYVLATPEGPDDADNPLSRCFGNEGTPRDVSLFEKRFGCSVTDNYGSTEGGISIAHTPDTPANALGVGMPGTLILDPATGEERARALFDEHGRLRNSEEAIGEIANVQTAASFEGYWKNPEADEERTRSGIYWSGDLGYRDAQGIFYFAGRNYDWLRVDGENFAAAPIEAVLMRHPQVLLAAVYAVPCPSVGDDVMAAVLPREGARFDGAGLRDFLAAQPDLGTKWAPRYLRVARELPVTPTNKILKRVLRAQLWECADPVWLRGPDGGYRPMTASDGAAIRRDFAARGRSALLDLERGRGE